MKTSNKKWEPNHLRRRGMLLRIVVLTFGVFFLLTACAAVPYKQFSEPHGELSVTYPSAWQPSWAAQELDFLYPAGREVLIRIRRYPTGRGDNPTAETYIDATLEYAKSYGGQIKRHEMITVAGRKATHMEYTSKQTWRDQHKELTFARMITVVEVVVPNGAQYYVLSLEGLPEDATQMIAEFDRMVASFLPGKPSKALVEWSGIYDGPREARKMIARSPEELHKMIGIFGQSVEKLIPEGGFDFKAFMLAGISLGQKPTGGYSVRIEDAREQDGVLYVRYRVVVPRPWSIVTQAITAPYHLRVLPASTAATVRFENIEQPDKTISAEAPDKNVDSLCRDLDDKVITVHGIVRSFRFFSEEPQQEPSVAFTIENPDWNCENRELNVLFSPARGLFCLDGDRVEVTGKYRYGFIDADKVKCTSDAPRIPQAIPIP